MENELDHTPSRLLWISPIPPKRELLTLPVNYLSELLLNEVVYISRGNEDNRAMGISNIDRSEAEE
jgi:hypothetical protein